MPVLLSSALHQQLLAEAAAAHPRECCGLLLGTADCIATALPCANIADDPHTRFEIDPAALIAAERAARQGGLPVLGHYHSHPNGSGAPSPRDAADAARDGRLWLIIAAGRISAWRSVTHGALHGVFDPVEMAPPTA